MKRAALGFRYLALDDELQIPTDREIKGAIEDKVLDAHQLAKLRKLRCYHNNKDKYNFAKRRTARTVDGQYNEAHRQAVKAGAGWTFTEETWTRKWEEAESVVRPGSELAVPAFALRGRHRYNNTCMVRIDSNEGWSPENTKIVFRGRDLTPGT